MPRPGSAARVDDQDGPLRTDHWLAGEVAAAERELAVARHEFDAAQEELNQARSVVDQALHTPATAQRLLDDNVPLPAVTHEPLLRARRQVAVA